MKNFVVWSMVCAVMVFAGCSKEKGAPTGKPATKVQEGSLAPDFTLRDLNGGEIRLSSLRGKVVLLNFWATWCPPCREEVPSMVKLNRAMAGKPFQMLAVSIDEGGKPAIEAFFKESKSNLPTFLDTDGSAGKLYGLTGVPETFVIDTKGVIMKKVIGAMDWSDPAVINYLDGLVTK